MDLALPLLLSSVALLCGILLFFNEIRNLLAKIVAVCRPEQALFKPLTRPKGTRRRKSPAFGMRAAAQHLNRNIPRIGGRRHAGSVCFVTGMSRTDCACRDCRIRKDDS